MWHMRAALIGMGVLLVLVPGVRADSLQLKNGNFVQGKYLGGTERAVQFEVHGRMRLYDIDEILSINFAAASADGGISSDSVDTKPSADAELGSAAKAEGGLGAAHWNSTQAPNFAAPRIRREDKQCSNRSSCRSELPDQVVMQRQPISGKRCEPRQSRRDLCVLLRHRFPVLFDWETILCSPGSLRAVWGGAVLNSDSNQMAGS